MYNDMLNALIIRSIDTITQYEVYVKWTNCITWCYGVLFVLL